MANISDVITDFILSTFGDDDLLQLSRNELANYFSCSPSQINYVLATRFTPDKGYLVESKRGGGGCIKVIRIGSDRDSILHQIYDDLADSHTLTANRAQSILSRLERDKVITESEYNLLVAAVSDKALSYPIHIADKLRVQIMRELILELAKRRVL